MDAGSVAHSCAERFRVGALLGLAAPFLFQRRVGEMAGEKEGEEGCVLGRVMSLSDMVLGFFEDGEGSPESYRDGGGDAGEGSGDDAAESPEERRAFWESQHELLQVNLGALVGGRESDQSMVLSLPHWYR